MRLTVSRAVFVAILVQIAIEWLSWSRANSHSSSPWVAAGFLLVRVTLSASIAFLAVRSGRRWSAPLPSIAAAFAATVIWAIVGILTGQFLAGGFGPGQVFGWMTAVTALAALGGIGGALVAYLLLRRDSFHAIAG